MDSVATVAALDIAPRSEVIDLCDRTKAETTAKLTMYIDLKVAEITDKIQALVDTVVDKLGALERKIIVIENANSKLSHMDSEIAQIRDAIAQPVSNVTAECVRSIEDKCFARVSISLADATMQRVDLRFEQLRGRVAQDCELIANDAARTVSINMLESHTMPRVANVIDSALANMHTKCTDLEMSLKTAMIPYERVMGGPNYDRSRDRITAAALTLDRSWGKSEIVASGDGIIIDSPIGRVLSAVMEDRRGTALRVTGAMSATPDGVMAVAGMYTPMLTGKHIAISGGLRIGPYLPVQSDADGVCMVLPQDAPLATMTTAERKIGLAGKPIIADRQVRSALADTSTAGIDEDGSIFGKSCRVQTLETNTIRPSNMGDALCFDGTARFDRVDVGQLRVTSEGFVLPIMQDLPKSAPLGSICLTADGMKVRLNNVWVPVA
jgi:hypothetical protein